MTIQTAKEELSNGGASPWAFTGQGRMQQEYKIVDRADGIYFWDTDGKRYLDGTSGAVVVNIGYGNEHVRQAMLDQANKFSYCARRFFASESNMKLIAKMTDMAGAGFDQAFLVSSGSAAVEAAMKLARQHAVVIGEETRWKIIGRMPGFHGATLGSSSVCGDPEHDEVFDALHLKMPKVPAPFRYRLPVNFDEESYARNCAQKLEETIFAEGPETVLAFIFEPVGGMATGALVACDIYYKLVRDICTKYGVLLIYDEVMSGAGRTGKFLAANHWPDGRPDIVVMAKGIGSGYTPIASILAPNWLVDRVSEAGGYFHSQTLAGNPLSAAIGCAVLEELERQDMMENAEKMGTLLRRRLNDVLKESTIVGDIRGMGLLNAIEIVADKQSKEILPVEVQACNRIAEIGRDIGLMLFARRPARGLYGEWLLIAPPLIITEAQVEELVGLVAEMITRFEREIGR